MKKIILLFCFLVCVWGNAQNQTLFLDKNYQEVLREAQQSNKPIALMFYATWCQHCKKMKNEVFTDADVATYYSSHFVCMAIDSESKDGTQLKEYFQKKFNVKYYPTIAYLDAHENLLNCISGEFKKEDFIKEGLLALTPETQFGTIKNEFYKDVSQGENCLRYIVFARKAGLDATSIAQTYLKTKKEDDYFTELNWKIMANGINNIEAKEVSFINLHKEDFAKVSSPIRVEKKLVFLASDNLRPLAELTDTLNYFRIRPIAAAFHIRKVDSLLFKFDLTICANAKNWKKYQKYAETSVSDFAWKDSNTLIQIATDFKDFIAEPKALELAISWTQQAITLGPAMNKYVLLTQLYMKTKAYTKALESAEQGKSIATSFGWKTDEIDRLITEIKTKKK
ncbi:thioredoxin family protein [Flavobacterium aciduliphilum]|uniref:Thioredoxin-like protein n=1 Tax=Flavobacterium aciduliphilum TaxID=1101402 RepID=A0A328YF27_9FLAO|nr:thioredoxin family protein [Flavobacterium aciduliphilum]RAR72611.1 thioredoxin-like protein [Flavobacterium aciduliphilum]